MCSLCKYSLVFGFFLFVLNRILNALSGFPATEQNLLRLRFKLTSGSSKKLDTKKVTELTLSLVDAFGASIKLPYDVSYHVSLKYCLLSR